MKKLPFQIIQVAIIAGTMTLFLSKLAGGTIGWYINERFTPLVVLAMVLLAAMVIVAAVDLLRKRLPERTCACDSCDDHHDHTDHADPPKANIAELAILCIPLLLGFAVPAKPLDSTAFDARSVNYSAPIGIVGKQNIGGLAEIPDELTILDWLQGINQPDREALLRRPASVVGFVYHDARLPTSQFMVDRFLVTCCAADAFPVGMAVSWANAEALTKDTWVHVRGSVKMAKIDGKDAPLIEATAVEIVDPPQQPYLFP